MLRIQSWVGGELHKMAQSIRNRFILCIWCGIFVLVSGCSSSGATPEPAASIVPSQTAAPASTQTPTSTPTSSPTPTETPAPSETPTPLPSETPTHTPLPTLTKAEREEYIKEQLVTNGGCTLPCIWNLNPGESSWQEAQSLMAYMNIPVQTFAREKGNMHFAGFTVDTGLALLDGGPTFYEQDGVVKIISLDTDDITPAPYYQIQNAMGDLGVPAYVGLNLNIKGPMGIPSVAMYDLFVRYGDTPGENGMERLWAELSYSGAAVKRGNSYRFCPTNPTMEGRGGSSASFRISLAFSLSLQSPDSPMTVDEYVSISEVEFSEPPDIEAATGVTLQEFYDLILQSDQPPCFDTPIDFWPER